jgi:MFS family permease
VLGGAIRQLTVSLRAVASVFGNPDLRRLHLAWAGISFSMWSFAIALGVYAFEVGGPAAVGVAALVRLLPGALASPFAGLLGDRHSRRTVLLLSAAASAAVLAAVAAAAALDSPAAIVFALAGMFTVASSAYVPAEGSLFPLVARTPQQLSAANVAHSAMDNGGFLLGSILTGVLLAVASTQVAFAAAAVAGIGAALLLARLTPDERPDYAGLAGASGVLRETVLGARTLLADARLRLTGLALTLLVFFEGAADVLIVIMALDLLGLGEGSVGYMNAAWGVGALAAGAALAVLLDRGNLAAGLLLGSLIAGAAMALPGVWAVAVAAYVACLGIGVGYTFVEVAARTLLQRLGSDESLARVTGFLETSRLAAMALGSIAAPALVALLGTRGALLAMGAVLPLFAVLRWGALRGFEIGAPVAERPFALLRRDEIFRPLPVDTLEGLSRDLVPVEAEPGDEVITQGDHGDRFYIIDSGAVEIFEDRTRRREQGEGESFGEIALLHDVRRTATVRATEATRLLALDREHFLTAVTGHVRSHETAGAVAEARLSGRAGEAPGP